MLSQEQKLDRVASETFRCLLRDFRRIQGPDFARSAEEAFNAGIKEFREFSWPSLGVIDANRYKAWLQLQHLHKRYRFTHDAFTDAELEDNTYNKYVKFQEQRSCYAPRTLRLSRVLREARSIAREILGDIDMDVFSRGCQIGKRATLGSPRSSAYIDCKLGDPKAFTCPSALRDWFFNDQLSLDPLLKGIIKDVFKGRSSPGKGPDLSADYLNLVLVPKSWKTHRPITPLSLVGLYYSYGVGACVSERLREHGLDIRHLQMRHQRLARKYSATKSHVTADLSSASDSLRSDILNAVLPRQWYTLVQKTFVRRVRINGVEYYTESVLPMGNGATFPVETLVFYCLIKAVGRLANVNGTYSVYGDDLIYPARIHPYVLGIFQDLGVGVNYEKTFVHSYFRESCGGDYYRGFDVRPAMIPERPSHRMVGLRYCQYLYKVLNALLRRWHELEIPGTVQWFYREILANSPEVLQVPSHFPDTAGLKVDIPKFAWYIPFSQPKLFFKNGSSWISFRFISEITAKCRPVISERPFYWDTLRSISSRCLDWHAGYGWFKDLRSSGVFTVHYVKGRQVAHCPSLDEGVVKKQVCTVSNWA